MAAFPRFYDPARIGELFYPDMAAIAAEASSAGLPSLAPAQPVVHLLLVDMQVDFCHPDGGLYIPGALGDIRRVIEFIYHHAERISHISCSLDSHLPRQIFFPTWWVGPDAEHPAPFTIISADEVRRGRWRAISAPEASAAYVRRLEQDRQKQLTIWPYHVQIGSVGNALDPELWSAVFWHSVARGTQPLWLTKGSVPETEHYSIIQPEVHVPDRAGAGKNQAFLDVLAAADAVFIAGEAESHCVLETLEDLVEEFGGKPDGLDRLYLLRDCTSPVIHPQINFHKISLARFAEFERQGLHIVDSTDQWPL